MTRDGVKGKRKAQAQNGADEESAEDHFLLPVDFPRRANEEVNGSADEHDATEQMSPEKIIKWVAIGTFSKAGDLPNVSRFRVKSEDGFEAGGEGRKRRPMSFV